MSIPKSTDTAEEIKKALLESDFFKYQAEEQKLGEEIINEPMSQERLVAIYASTLSSTIQEMVLEHPECPIELLKKIANNDSLLESRFAKVVLKSRLRL